MWASRRAAIILSNSLPTSSRRHIGLYADGESKGRPSLFSRINLAVLHARGYTPSLRHLVNRLCRRAARVFIDSAQTRPVIPSGPCVTSLRDAILFVAAKSSFWVTRSSSLYSMVSLRWEDVVRLVLPLSLLSRRRGNKVPMTLANNPGFMFAVTGGRGGWWSQLLRDQSVGPLPWVGFDRLDQFHPGPGFRVLDLLLESASLLPVALVAAGDLLFITSPPAPSPLESSSCLSAFSSEFRDLFCPQVCAAVACSAAGYGARHRGVASCAHVLLQVFRFLVDAAFLRCPCISAPRGYGDRRLEQVSVLFLQ
jgi:hypothetical protein